MDEKFFANPLAQARVDELLQMPKAELGNLALAPTPNVRSHTPRSHLARWHKQELAYKIAYAEFSHDGPHEP